jgi:hypothetical protein
MLPASVHNPFTRRDQTSFIVEMHSESGYSGSAVVLYLSPLSPRIGPDRDWSLGPQVGLLGLDWGHVPDREEVLDEEGDRLPEGERLYVKRNTGLAAVIPGWYIRTMLEEDEDLVKQRKRREKALLEGQARYKGAPIEVDMDPPLIPPTRREGDLTGGEFFDDLRKIEKQPKESPPHE